MDAYHALERVKWALDAYHAGMSWRNDGGQAVLAVRSLIQSDRWANAWTLIAAQFTAVISNAA